MSATLLFSQPSQLLLSSLVQQKRTRSVPQDTVSTPASCSLWRTHWIAALRAAFCDFCTTAALSIPVQAGQTILHEQCAHMFANPWAKPSPFMKPENRGYFGNRLAQCQADAGLSTDRCGRLLQASLGCRLQLRECWRGTGTRSDPEHRSTRAGATAAERRSRGAAASVQQQSALHWTMP